MTVQGDAAGAATRRPFSKLAAILANITPENTTLATEISSEGQAFEEEQAALRARNSARNSMTSAERAAADRAELYATHEARGTLGTYYQMYPDEAPAPTRDRGRSR